MSEKTFAATRFLRWRRYILEGLVLLVLLLLIHFWQTRLVPSGSAPEFSGQLASGESISLAAFRAAHPGQPIALHFWAEWCPICQAEEGNISELIKNTPVLTIAMQSGDTAAVRQVLANRQLQWPVVVDNDGKLSERYGVQSVPAFIVIDPTGKLRFAELGYTTGFGMRWRLWWADQVP